MNDFIEESTPVTRHLVPEDQRLAVTAGLFGAYFPLAIEPVVFSITERMAKDYHGGYWNFYQLSNSGFYVAPEDDQVFAVSCDNYFTGKLSADALGVVSCMYTFSHLSFSRDQGFGRLCAEHYHRLRGYMFTHPEVSSILGATD
jgi:hypothetical protein